MRVLMCLAGFVALWLGIKSAYAQFVEKQGVIVNVRRVLATQPRSGRMRVSNQLAPELNDLSRKLSQLHFANFKLLTNETHDLRFNNTASLELGDGHLLSVKPSYRAKDKVCLWLRWTDPKGSEVLNTKLHLKAGEAVVTGTEENDQSGTVLAISAVPAPAIKGMTQAKTEPN